MALPTHLYILQRASQPLEIVAARLRSCACDLQLGTSAQAAFEAIDQGGIDVVLIDAWVDDGMALLAEMKASPGLRHVPVVVVTAEEPAGVAAHALALGADDLFVLPIDDAELEARIRALSRLAVMEVERHRRAAVLAPFTNRATVETPAVPALDRLAILLIGQAGADQVQVMTALSGAATAAYAETTEGALERLRRDDIDVALITSGQGPVDLRQLCESIRNDPALFDLPVLIIAQPDQVDEPAQLFELGVSDVLLQPFQPEVLRLRVQGWVRQQRLRRRLRGQLEGGDPSAAVDRLSRLYAHGFLHAYVDHLIAENRPIGVPLTVVGLAVGDMTLINRTLGYALGDRLLATVATQVMRSARAEDLAARFGDDRFCVVLNGVTAEEARTAAERLATILTQEPLELDDEGTTVWLPLLTGVAELAPDDDAASLLARSFAELQASELRRAS
jgi:two-component system cell cycle response regulator